MAGRSISPGRQWRSASWLMEPDASRSTTSSAARSRPSDRRASHPAQTAVDREGLRGDVDAFVRQEEQHGIGDLPRGRLAAEGNMALAAIGTAGSGLATVGRVDEAGIDEIGPDAAARSEMGDVAHQ